ncbi:hypothetical protein [Clostridium sp. K04]|uniref:hypothetical protein n=1 Tax=Clostridium sp. K04 TaxID=2718929 RepID=UPI001C8BC0A0|nr:hypothetical protein [Clostridium sp. K04]MBX9184567.1 hypothetical protein [Clostridium sp. K04]
MKERILELAILRPNGHPWQKANLGISKREIDSILKEMGLISKYERAKLNKLIKFTILKESKGRNDNEEIVKLVKSILSKDIELNSDIITKIQKIMNLDNEEDIRIYNSFLNGELDVEGFRENLQSSLSWLVEVFTIYFVMKEELTIEELNNNICEFINKLFSNTEHSKEIKSRVHLAGYGDNNSLINLKKYLSDYREEILTLFNIIENKKFENKLEVEEKSKVEEKLEIEEKSNELTLDLGSESDINISDSIIDMFLSKPTSLDVLDDTFNIEVDIKNNNIESSIEEINNETVEETIEEKVVSIEESEELITLSREKYNKLIEADKEREIKVLKDLANIRNGAVLSELYNAYKNINDISKENLEIILANLFNALNQYGFEAIEDRKLVGENITVNTKDVLKEFIFTNPINKDGLVEGKVEYLGWSYNGKQVVPMVIKPI